MAESSESGDDVIPLNEETQIALSSEENERRLALPVTIPSFKLDKGTFDRANFGPQTNTKHVEANTIEHATITHVHHHYGGDDKSEESPSTSGATAARPKQELEEGFVQITDGIFMNTNKPLKEGIKIYEGYQEHVTGQRQLLAIKAIFPFTKKSTREVKHLVTLTPHPNVVRIIWSKKQQTPLPTLYIAMELCSSKNLHDYLNENREKNIPFDFTKTMSYSKRLVEAMKHIHHNRIIHGDLKPENILFSLDGDQIKISDFGISKELRKSRSSTRLTSQGTDGYRAPETYKSDIISMKADVCSLGFTLYCLWTNGKHPFGPNPYRWVVNIIDNTGRDLSGLPEEMGSKKDEFLDLLDKMLQVDPENRPTIEEISQHPFLNSSQATAQASLTKQLSLVTPPEKPLAKLSFAAPTGPESSLFLEETRPKEGREAVMEWDPSPQLKSSPKKATHRVFGSAQTRPKKDPDHQHITTSSSDPRDDDPWRKKLRITNIPKHLSSNRELRRHFERFGGLEELHKYNKTNFAWIPFHNHIDALAAKYGAVSAGLDQNLVIKWDDEEDPGHLHRMASSSDPLDDDPLRKKLRVTNIPKHLSSYKALRWHFKRFGQLEECLMNEKWDFACITFCNHHDSLTARHEAVSAGPNHNLIIEWDVSEDEGSTRQILKALGLLLLPLWLPMLLKKSILRDIIQLLLLLPLLVLSLPKDSELRDKIQTVLLLVLVLVVVGFTGSILDQ